MILSIGDQVSAGNFSFHSQFEKVVNYISKEQRLLSLVLPSVGEGPNNIVLEKFPTKVWERLTIDDKRIGPYESKDALPYSSKMVLGPNLDLLLEDFKATVVQLGHRLSLAFIFDRQRSINFTTSFEKAYFQRVYEALATVDLGKMEEALFGLGPGLTPSGDDFIAGMLIGFNMLERIRGSSLLEQKNILYRRYPHAPNLFSRTALYNAFNGFLFFKLKELVYAISSFSVSLEGPVRELSAFGETSGVDLMCGLIWVLERRDLW